MVRKALLSDLPQIEESYNEHFRHEEEHGAFTLFRKGVYPTRADAEKAARAGTLYVYEAEGGVIGGSVVADHCQPEGYRGIPWAGRWPEEQVLVLHLLLVRPSMAGRGIATALVEFALELAEQKGCKAVRLDTGAQNLPALSLYRKLGFSAAASAPGKVGSRIGNREQVYLEKRL